MRRHAWVLLGFGLLSAPLVGPAGAAEVKEEKVDGYLEWRLDDVLVADGQRIRVAPTTKFKGKGEAKAVSSIPLGYELKAKGLRDDLGFLVARELEAKPNGSAMFEGEVKSATDAAEQRSVQAGRFLEGEGWSPRAWDASTTTAPRSSARGASSTTSPPLPGSRRLPRLRHRQQGVERLRHGQLLHLRLHRSPEGHGRRRAGHRARPRDGACDPRAHEAAVQEADVDPARRDRPGGSGGSRHRQRQGAGGHPARHPLRRHRAHQRLRPRPRGPGRPGGPALRLRRGVRHHQGTAPLDPLRQEVRGVSQGGQLLLQRSLALLGAGGQPREAAPLQLPRGAEEGRALTDPGRRPGVVHQRGHRPGPPLAGSGDLPRPHRCRRLRRRGHGAQGDQARHDHCRRLRLLGRPREQLAFGGQTKWVYPSLSVIFEGGRVKEVRF